MAKKQTRVYVHPQFKKQLVELRARTDRSILSLTKDMDVDGSGFKPKAKRRRWLDEELF